MRLAIVWNIFRKEITESLRDRITLAVLFGLPLLVYPLLLIGISKVQKTQAATEDQRVSKIVIWGDPPAALDQRLQRTNRLAISPRWTGASETLRQALVAGTIPPPAPAPPRATVERRGRERADSSTNALPESPLVLAARAIITRGDADAVLVIWPGFTEALDREGEGRASIFFDSVKPTSNKAGERLEFELSAWRSELMQARLRSRGLDGTFNRPLNVRSENVAPARRQAGHLIGGLLPLLLVLLSATGALYASIDLTAGEKDRFTMQTLLCAPVNSLEIIAGKFLTVWVISLLGAGVNSASLLLTIARVALEAGAPNLSPVTLLLAIACLVPITCTISAFFLAVAMLARDAKDAGNFLAASLTILMVPMGVTALPGIELSPATCFVPLVNIALLIKALFLAELKPDLVFLALVGAAIHALLALLFAARVFSREQVLLGGPGGFRSLLPSMRGERGRPTPTVALTTFALMFVVMFYASLAFEKAGLTVMVLATQYGCFLAPALAVALAMRLPLVETFSLRVPHWRHVIGCVLLGASSGLAIAGLALRVLPAPESLADGLEKLLLLGDTPVPLWQVWAVIAITPALCEETLFRGLILSGLRRLGPVAAIGLSALLFGLAHSSIYRLLPTLGLGLVLGYAAWRSGSIYCSMLIHALNNGLIATLVHHEAAAGRLHLAQATQLPWSITLGALAVMGLGLALLSPSSHAPRPPPGR